MHSSISNSDDSLPRFPWLRILSAATLIFFIFAFYMEFKLAKLGYHPAVSDSRERWANERARARELGAKALILIGASRMQLDVDLDAARRASGLEPVQLALDGSPSDSILAGLADDPEIRGTVLVDYYDYVMNDEQVAYHFQQDYERHRFGNAKLSPSAQLEKYLTEFRQKYLLSYSGGASPLNSLRTRILPDLPAQQFRTILADRSGLLDFSLSRMPEYYFRRVAGYLHIGRRDGLSEKFLKEEIAQVRPADNGELVDRAHAIRASVEKIEKRGGRVLFIAMPSSGMVKEIEERRYPRSGFWDVFVATVQVPAVRSADTPALSNFQCPDGSHLDFRDRTRFTVAMMRALHLATN